MSNERKQAIKARMKAVKATFTYSFGFRIRVYPSAQQADIMLFNCHTARYIYNAKVFRDWGSKQHAKWLNTDSRLDTNMPSMAIRNYQASWNMWRKVNSAGTPKPKRKDQYRFSYQTKNSYPAKSRQAGEDIFNGAKVKVTDSHHIQIPKVGRLKASANNIKHLPHEKGVRIGVTTIKQEPNGAWYVSFQIKANHPLKQALPKTGSEIGIDLNLSNFLTDDQGHQVPNPRYYRKMLTKLAKQDRKVARRRRRAKKEHRRLLDSRNYQKSRRQRANLHSHIAHQRNDFLHRTSTVLIQNHDLIVSEELRGKNMLKNHALAMSISDVGWRTFISQLEYKAELYGRTYITVNPAYTTKRCHCCQAINHQVKLGQEKWRCPNCHVFHIRDHNAAINIKNKGLALLQEA